ncbi:TatD family hydrolase [Oscillatoria laete-virens NRMC-F 0139]|nr:TatD family hydrolase [Oscillatoria laete-virens]MDL5054245.1 TatD family hydrolase [Oscillatoria laete-virens NRMC-F 0139]
MELIETHAHLDYPDFDADREELIAQATAAGVTQIVSIGTKASSSRAAVELAARYPQVHAAVGWHPTDCEDAPEDVVAVLEPLARQPKVAAIGETGLDYHHLPSESLGPEAAQEERDALDLPYKKKQESIFRQQLDLAVRLGLNVVVHQRDAFEDCLRIMTEYRGKLRGVWHCFVNGPDQARRIFEIGSLISFTGIVTFKNARELHETVKALPLEMMMVETDCPYLAPVPFRGKRCVPAHTRLVAEQIASLKGVTLDEVARATTANARDFFRF